MTVSSVDGLLVVDKPAEWTSHDVVGRVRKLAGTRKVGHAGTLDPMATGVLVLGLGRATRLLGYLALKDKAYSATVRLGQQTVTDDAEGDLEAETSAAAVTIEEAVTGLSSMVGDIEQVPSKVSAVKVDGERAYKRVREGESVDLAPRPVHVDSIVVHAHTRPTPNLLDLDVDVVCSSGTYVRAIARDLGTTLGVGGHLTRLRRTRVGSFSIDQARMLDELTDGVEVLPLAAAVRTTFPDLVVDDTAATSIRHGRPVPYLGPDQLTGVFDADGNVLALMEPRDGELRVVVGFTG
jgi:tRNA pseudouridine55 synthase